MRFLLPAFAAGLHFITTVHASTFWRGKFSTTTSASYTKASVTSSSSSSVSSTSTISSSDRNVQLGLGDLAPGIYSFGVNISNGTLTDTTISDNSGKIYANTYPGWAWGAATYPQEMAFKIDAQAKGTTFTAKSSSPGIQLTYDLIRTDTAAVAIYSDILVKGYIATFNKSSTRTPKLDLGDLPVGDYTFAVDIFNGTLQEMAVVDVAGRVYGSAAPGWAWGIANYPQEMSFRLEEPASSVKFVAVTVSVDFAMAYRLILKL